MRIAMALLSFLLLAVWSVAGASDLVDGRPNVPTLMVECEGQNNATCGTWRFNGIAGTGHWDNGAIANLTVLQFEPNWVIIRRADPFGTSGGLTGNYVGKINGNRVEGTVTWIWLGHWNQAVQGTWYATFETPKSDETESGAHGDAAQMVQGTLQGTSRADGKSGGEPARQDIPHVMHWCAAHCMTLIWENGHYTDASAPGSATWTVESFTRESVIMHRTDYRPYPGTAVLSGKMSSQGNAIVDGTIQWTSHPCCGLSSGPFSSAWGSALDTVPGSDEVRDRRQQSEGHTAGTETATVNGVSTEQIAVCTSKAIQSAMQYLEDQVVHDRNGALVSALVNALTGVDASSRSATVVGAKMSSDGGLYTSKDPGSFICQGLFVHNGANIEVDPESPGASDLSAEVAQEGEEIMAQSPQFAEWYKVNPLEIGRYRLTLLPSSMPLSQEYVTDFACQTP